MWFLAGPGQDQESQEPCALMVITWFPGPSNSRLQTADLLSATAEQLTATAEQQTCTPYPQPYAPDKQGPADLSHTGRSEVY